MQSDTFDPAGFAQRQLDAYNARDLDRFVAEYTDDVVAYRLTGSEPFLVGKQAFAEHYRKNRFVLEGLRAELVNRMVFGNKVIDQERVHGVGPSPMEVAAIYEVTPRGISKVWFVSSESPMAYRRAIVEIRSVPHGEAPLWVREKWVGLRLPTVLDDDQLASARTFVRPGAAFVLEAACWRLCDDARARPSDPATDSGDPGQSPAC